MSGSLQLSNSQAFRWGEKNQQQSMEGHQNPEMIGSRFKEKWPFACLSYGKAGGKIFHSSTRTEV